MLSDLVASVLEEGTGASIMLPSPAFQGRVRRHFVLNAPSVVPLKIEKGSGFPPACLAESNVCKMGVRAQKENETC